MLTAQPELTLTTEVARLSGLVVQLQQQNAALWTEIGRLLWRMTVLEQDEVGNMATIETVAEIAIWHLDPEC